jgi:hypothetical protein
MTRWVNVGIGLGLLAAAFLLAGPGSIPRTADGAAGVALVAVSLLARPGTSAGFSAIVLGAWLMIAPAALRYPREVNAIVDVVSGFVVVAATVQHGARERRPGRA